MKILTINDMDGHTNTFHATTQILKKLLEQIIKTKEAENHDELIQQLPKIPIYTDHAPYEDLPPGAVHAWQTDADEHNSRKQLIQLLENTGMVNARSRGGNIHLTEIQNKWPTYHYEPLT